MKSIKKANRHTLTCVLNTHRSACLSIFRRWPAMLLNKLQLDSKRLPSCTVATLWRAAIIPSPAALVTLSYKTTVSIFLSCTRSKYMNKHINQLRYIMKGFELLLQGAGERLISETEALGLLSSVLSSSSGTHFVSHDWDLLQDLQNADQERSSFIPIFLLDWTNVWSGALGGL